MTTPEVWHLVWISTGKAAWSNTYATEAAAKRAAKLRNKNWTEPKVEAAVV